MAVTGRARRICLTGGTGYLGSRLAPLLLERGHAVRVICRSSSAANVPPGCEGIAGDVLDPVSLRDSMRGCDTVVQLVGVPKPAPWKGPQFRAVDRTAGLASIRAAGEAGIAHFLYVSVAHPAPIMKDYIAVRVECEGALRASGLRATILRPWYILGPGHWWPLLLQPVYWACERLAGTSQAACRLGLVTLNQMLAALVWAVDHPPASVRVLEVPQIKTADFRTA